MHASRSPPEQRLTLVRTGGAQLQVHLHVPHGRAQRLHICHLAGVLRSLFCGVLPVQGGAEVDIGSVVFIEISNSLLQRKDTHPTSQAC